MRKVDLYRKYAADCREIARTALPTYQQRLKTMAETWEQLAEARKDELQQQDKSEDARRD